MMRSVPPAAGTGVPGPGRASVPTTPPGLRSTAVPAGLYVHFPFCAHRCHYCDFSVRRARIPPVGDWLDAIELEIEGWFAATSWEAPPRIDTLFVGGGTPSLLGADGARRLAALLRRRFCWDPGALEWTMEANPASFDVATGRAWRELGVTRLSLGVQSLDDGVLRWLGRLHDAERALRALSDARAAGFERINADLMFGLPGEVERRWSLEVERLLGAGAGHVSAYGLTIEPATPLGRRVATGRVRPPDEKRYEAEYLEVVRALVEAGYGHYEVSNFARPGEECRHNWKYWDGEPYLGVGPSAHSFLPPYRTWNAFGWDAYRGTIRAVAPPLEGWERPTAEQRELERLWLRLRTRRGLAVDDPAWRSGPASGLRDRWIREGWLAAREGRVAATPRGWLRLDELVTEIAAREAGPDEEASWPHHR